MTRIEIEAFGFHFGPAPEAHLVLDTRYYLRDPARAREAGVLDLTGLDPVVRRLVLSTPGSSAAIATVVLFGSTFPAGRGPCRIAVGCVGGKHRSVTITDEAATMLRQAGHDVETSFTHAHLPRVLAAEER